MNVGTRKTQRGFTLIEIAVVLVIIGLLLGGVLRGQELINSARTKNLVQEIRSVATMVYTYQDRFRRLPGDDPDAESHVGGNKAAGSKVGDGKIDGDWDSKGPTDESVLFWQHVRLANLATGPTTVTADTVDAVVPVNAVGGRLGVTSSGPTDLKGSFVVCSGGLTGRFARQVDTTLDDGNGATGSTRIYTTDDDSFSTALSLTSANDDTGDYVVCVAN